MRAENLSLTNKAGKQVSTRSFTVIPSRNTPIFQPQRARRRRGSSVSYDKIIVMDFITPPIDEYSVLWVDTLPILNADGSLKVNDAGEVITPHDYVVKKVAKSLNSVSIAISKVTVSG